MQDIRDSMEPEELSPSEFPWWVLWFALPVLAFAAFFLYRRRHRRPTPLPSPEAVARRRLDALSAIQDPPAFCAALTAILAQYLEARLQLGASRLTSVEIARAFQRIGVMDTAWQESLEALLAECDRARFGAEPAADWDQAAAIARARRTFDLLAANIASAPSLSNPWEHLGSFR